MCTKKLNLFSIFIIFFFNYSLFCPTELKKIEIDYDTTWSTREIFNQDGVIVGLDLREIRLILRGPSIIVVTGPHKLFLVDLTILPNDPDVFSMKDEMAELILENCTFILDGTNLNLDVKNIKIIGNVEFVGLNPGIIKRALGSLVSWMFTEALAERFVLDYPYVVIPHSNEITGANPYFTRTILERYPHLIKTKLESDKKPPKRVHFQNGSST